MTIPELILELRHPTNMPNKAIDDLLARKEETIPALLEIVQELLHNNIDNYFNRLDHIFALYMLSYFREQRAFPYIIRLAHAPTDQIDTALDNEITEGMARWFCSTYNGDFDALKSVIEKPTIDCFVRGAALDSLLGLFTIDKLSRDEIIDYLRSLMHSELIQDWKFATFVVSCANRIYPEELYENICQLYKQDLIDVEFISKKDIEISLALGKERCLQENIYTYLYVLPITKFRNRLKWMYFEEHHGPFLNIGRNEPCICSSGKKYKKCCIQKFS